MNKNRRSAVALAGALLAVLGTTLQSPAQELTQQVSKNQHYQFIDLGTLGGPNSYLPALPPYHDVLPSASLSRSGTFAGFADTPIPDFSSFCFNSDCFASHAISWKHGSLTDLGTLPGPTGISSAATWISDNGLIVGFSENGMIDPLVNVPAALGVLWKDGEAINLGTVEGGYESLAFAVNNSGQVVGSASNLVSDPNSLWGTATQARAFLWEKGEMQDLGTLPGGTDAMALFVNERGQIVGQSYSANSIAPGCSDSPLTPDDRHWDLGRALRFPLFAQQPRSSSWSSQSSRGHHVAPFPVAARKEDEGPRHVRRNLRFC